MRPVIYLTEENPVIARDLSSALMKNGYEVVVLAADEIAAMLQDCKRQVVILANADRGGLDLAREARSIRSDAGVIYTAAAPHRISDTAKVRGAPMLRAPITPNQLVSVVGALAG